MKKIMVILLVSIFVIGFASNVSAHKAEIVGNYKIDLGWKNEPPVVNEPNAIELILTLASDFEKDFTQLSSTTTNESDLTGLADKLEVTITLNGKKTSLNLNEDSHFPGVYHGDFTPDKAGSSNVHVYGKIMDIEFERTFHPEKIEESTISSKDNSSSQITEIKIPEWVKNNVRWWVESQVDDKTFASGIQFLLKEKIIIVPATEKGTSQNTIIPEWVKNNARWWSDGQIDDKTFASGIQFLIKQGIIQA